MTSGTPVGTFGQLKCRIDFMAHVMKDSAIGKWFLLWTSIGCIFAVQLWWYYELPWPLAIFWGISDWYLWGLLAIGVLATVRHLKNYEWSFRSRVVLYVLSAPVIVATHVGLTMIVGGIANLPVGQDWLGYFQALFAKKLMLNLLTISAVVVACEYLCQRAARRDGKFLAHKRGSTRLVDPEQINWGEVNGNYVILHTDDGAWPVRETLTRLMGLLPEDLFLKVSRSHMVNLDQVRGFKDGPGGANIVLLDGSNVRVSRRYAALVRQALRKYCLNGNP